MTTEAQRWLATMPSGPQMFASVQTFIDEGRRRGYCICPRERRWLVFPRVVLTCGICGQPETRCSYDFWYATVELPQAPNTTRTERPREVRPAMASPGRLPRRSLATLTTGQRKTDTLV